MKGKNPVITPITIEAPEACEFCGEAQVVMVLADHPKVRSAQTERRKYGYRPRGSPPFAVVLLDRHGGDVYAACPNCLLGLVAHSLSPQQFMRAKDAGGNTDRFYLHGDFYTDLGTALQPAFEIAPICPQCGGQVTGEDRLAAHLASAHGKVAEVG